MHRDFHDLTTATQKVPGFILQLSLED